MTCLALMACNALALQRPPAQSHHTSLLLTGALIALTSGLLAPCEPKLPKAVEHTLLVGGGLEAAANLAVGCLVSAGKPCCSHAPAWTHSRSLTQTSLRNAPNEASCQLSLSCGLHHTQPVECMSPG
jgi:hypothetical protein